MLFLFHIGFPEKVYFGINRDYVDDEEMIKKNYILNGFGCFLSLLDFVVYWLGSQSKNTFILNIGEKMEEITFECK